LDKRKCIQEALKFDTKNEWAQNSRISYMAAQKFKWIKECSLHMPLRAESSVGIIWTEDKCLKEALKFNTIKEWRKNSHTSYVTSVKKKILEKCQKHMKIIRCIHTLKSCMEEALKYTSRGEWEKNEPNSYTYAYRKNILNQCTVHMKIISGISGAENDLFNILYVKFSNVYKLSDRRAKIEGKPHIQGFDIDIFIPGLNKGIEFDGTYYHSFKGLKRGRSKWPDEDLKNYHQIKDGYFLTKGIQILHIKEEDWLKDKKECVQRCLEFLSK
jgi:hypothetical protein